MSAILFSLVYATIKKNFGKIQVKVFPNWEAGTYDIVSNILRLV